MIVQALSQMNRLHMARKPKLNHPSFFKIMVGDFSTKLRVPPAFVNNFKQKSPPLKFTIYLIRSVVELSWEVKVERSSDGFDYFTRGWSKVVKDLQLAKGDFLVFYLVADDAFHLAVYDTTCYLKEITLAATSNGNYGSINQGISVKEEVSKEARNQKKSPFVKTLATYNRSYCSLPKWFIRESGLSNKNEIVVTDGFGRNWNISLKYRGRPSHRYELSTGWSEFRKDNGLAAGDKVEFKHIEGCVLKLKVLSRRN